MRKSSRTVLGLDVGQHTAKAVLATANASRIRILRMETLPMPEGMDAGKLLRNWIEEQELGGVPTAISIGGSRVLYQHFTKEPGDPRTPEQIAAVEAVRFGEMTDAAMTATATPASPEDAERKLLLSLVRPDLLQVSLKPPLDAGLKLVNVIPAGIALYNGVVSMGEPIHQPTLFADLGATHTEVIIGNGQGVRFARSFAMGTTALTQAVAQQGRLPPGQAERVRLAAKTFAELPGETAKVCEQFVLRWLQEIKACLQMDQQQMGPPNDSTVVRRLLISGGGSLWEPLFAALKAQSPLPLQPLGRIADHEDRPSAPFGIAMGLAADALHIGRAPASLLPASLRAGLTRERNKRYWAAAGVFTFLTLGSVAAANHVSLSREREVLMRHNDTLQRCERIARDLQESLARIRLLESMKRPLVQFVDNSARIRDLTLFVANAMGPGDFLTFLGDSESYLELRVLAESPEEDTDPQLRQMVAARRRAIERRSEGLRDRSMDRIIVEGFTRQEDLSTVRALIVALRTHPEVAAADLLPDDFVFPDPVRDELWQSTRTRRFVLDLRLNPSVPPLPESAQAAATPPVRRPR